MNSEKDHLRNLFFKLLVKENKLVYNVKNVKNNRKEVKNEEP